MLLHLFKYVMLLQEHLENLLLFVFLQSKRMLLLQIFKNYLEKNYSYQITLYDVAGAIHMNYSYLSAYISQNTGKHFSDHLNETRIRHAKEMLDTTSHSISFISEIHRLYRSKLFWQSI